MTFELFCYALVAIAILWLRSESPVTPVAVAPIAEPVITLPVTSEESPESVIESPESVITLPEPVKPVRAAKTVTPSATCVIPVASIDSIASPVVPVLPVGWDLDKNGNPLRGAALAGRKRKYLKESEHGN